MRVQTGELLEPMARADRMLEGHLEGILADSNRSLTTVFMEGINSLFSAVKRKARGCRTVEYMTTMLYIVAGIRTLTCSCPTESSEEPKLSIPKLFREFSYKTNLRFVPNKQQLHDYKISNYDPHCCFYG